MCEKKEPNHSCTSENYDITLNTASYHTPLVTTSSQSLTIVKHSPKEYCDR